MKTRAFKKAISVVCVLSMLISLCVVSFVGTSSAAMNNGIVDTLNSGSAIEYTLYNNGVKEVKSAVPGSALPTIADSNFIGWFDTTLTTEYTAYPAEATTIVAKYNGTVTGFDNGIFLPNAAKDQSLTVAADPDDATNMVAKLSKSVGNLHFSPFGAEGATDGLKLTIGKTYVVEFEYKISDLTSGHVSLGVRGCAKANIGTMSGKTGTLGSLNIARNTSGWEKGEIIFNFSSTEDKPYFIFLCQAESGTATVCLDNFVIKPYVPSVVTEDFEMDFEDDGEDEFAWSKGNSFTYNSGNGYVTRGEIVEDNQGDKAFKLMHFQKKKGNIYFTVDNGSKQFAMVVGGIYTVEFDYFVEHSETETHVSLYYVNGESGSIKTITKVDEFVYRDDVADDGWAHAKYVFEATSDASGRASLGIGLYNGTNCPEEYASVVYFDNVVVRTNSATGEDSLIVFDSMGGDECDPMAIVTGETPDSLPAPTRYGYNFAGWQYDVTTGEGDEAITESFSLTTATTIPEGIFNVYATWTLQDGVIEIGFRTNSEEYDANVGTIVAFPGQPVLGMPEDPTYDNQTFVGWYTDRNLTNAFDVNAAPAESTILYAKWETEGIVVDYEDYTITDTGRKSDRYKLITEENGNKCLSHSLTYGTNKSADAIARAMFQDAGKTIRAYEGAPYKITFKYKVTDFKSQGKIFIFLSSSTNTWGNYKQQSASVAYTDNTDGWVEGVIEFDATIGADATAADNYMAFGCNGDATVYFDDVIISCPENDMNIYGSAIRFNVNGGKAQAAVCGDPGDTIKLPVPKKAGYKFAGWYADSKLEVPFEETVFGEEAILLHAKWQLGKFEEGFEDYPASVQQLGFGGGYSFYTSTAVGYDSSNIRSGKFSIFRNGATAGVKQFTLMRSGDLALNVGDTYTITLWVKPTAITANSGAISLMSMASFTGITAATPISTIANYVDLKEGEWQKVEYTFTATSQFLALGTTAGCDMYIDDITITLKGYTGSAPTGDNSVNPMVILAVVILSAGVLLVTGKKVFSK